MCLNLHYNGCINYTNLLNLSDFKELLPRVKTAIDSADFISIDTELTGLGGNDNRPNGLDMPEERYNKLRKVSVERLLVM